MDMPIHPGDPLTPGWGAVKGARRIPREQAEVITKIPVMPISYGDALPMLRALSGPVAPEAWRGALGITYHIGSGPARVHLKVSFDWSMKTLYDVIARIEGSTYPDEWVIFGNHHDAWVNGADDPTSGQVALMETGRAFGELLKHPVAGAALLRERARELDEQAARLRGLAVTLHHERCLVELAGLLKAADKDVDLLRAALLVARLDNE